jgi:hypothetical protein
MLLGSSKLNPVPDVALPLGEAFHSRRLRLISSQVGAVAPSMRGRRSYGERMAQALALLADPARLSSHVSSQRERFRTG